MRIIEPFTIYQCTLCNTVHTTVASDGTIYEEHLGHADIHGVVKRYVVNDKLVEPIGVITLIYFVLFWAFAAIQLIAHWPFGRGWKMPPILVWSSVFAGLLSAFTFDSPLTFGRSPWGTEQGSRTTRFLRELRVLQGGIAGWVCIIGFMVLLEGLSYSDVLKSAGGFATIDVALLLMFYAPVNPYWTGFRPHDWLKFLFFSWFFLTLDSHYFSLHFAWGIATIRALKVAVPLVLIPPTIIGFVRAVRFITLRLLVLSVRLWRSAERIADEQERKKQ